MKGLIWRSEEMVREVREVGIGPSSHQRFGDGVSYARWEATPSYFLLLCAALAACIRSTGRIVTAL